MQFSSDLRNRLLTAFEQELGVIPFLGIFGGTIPANCAAANAGSALASIALPADPFTGPTNGVLTKSGTWSDLTANATGTATHYRFFKQDGTTCVAQGPITANGGGGEITLNTTSIVAGQVVEISSLTLTAPGP